MAIADLSTSLSEAFLKLARRRRGSDQDFLTLINSQGGFRSGEVIDFIDDPLSFATGKGFTLDDPQSQPAMTNVPSPEAMLGGGNGVPQVVGPQSPPTTSQQDLDYLAAHGFDPAQIGVPTAPTSAPIVAPKPVSAIPPAAAAAPSVQDPVQPTATAAPTPAPVQAPAGPPTSLMDFPEFRLTFNKKAGEPGFNAKFDVNTDGTIDMTDFIALAQGLKPQVDATLGALGPEGASAALNPGTASGQATLRTGIDPVTGLPLSAIQSLVPPTVPPAGPEPPPGTEPPAGEPADPDAPFQGQMPPAGTKPGGDVGAGADLPPADTGRPGTVTGDKLITKEGFDAGLKDAVATDTVDEFLKEFEPTVNPAFGREAQSGIEEIIAQQINKLSFDPQAIITQRDAEIETRYNQAARDLARQFVLTPGGLDSGNAIDAFERLATGKASEQTRMRTEVLDKANAETRANIETMQSVGADVRNFDESVRRFNTEMTGVMFDRNGDPVKRTNPVTGELEDIPTLEAERLKESIRQFDDNLTQRVDEFAKDLAIRNTESAARLKTLDLQGKQVVASLIAMGATPILEAIFDKDGLVTGDDVWGAVKKLLGIGDDKGDDGKTTKTGGDGDGETGATVAAVAGILADGSLDTNDPGVQFLKRQGFSDDDIKKQISGLGPTKRIGANGTIIDTSKVTQAAGLLAAGELADKYLPGMAGNVAKGAAQGAAVGSIVPVVGTAVGAAIGGALAAIGGFLGVGLSGHNDRVIESSWHPAVLDVLYQQGFKVRDAVKKDVLDTIAKELGIPYQGKNSVAFRRSDDNFEKQDKEWRRMLEDGEITVEEMNQLSLAARVGVGDVDLSQFKKAA